MARPRTVSQWGPNAQGVRSRPSRAVSLRDVRDLPVQRMGFNFDEFDRLVSEGTSEGERNPWDLVEDPATGELVERGSIKRGLASHPGFNLPEVVATAIEGMGERWDEADWEDMEAVHAEVMGKILESGTPMEDPSDLVWDEIEAQSTPPDVEEREWGEDRSVGLSEGARRLVEQPGAPIREPQGPIITSSGLTADQAFRQHLAMSGRQDPNQGYFPGFEGPNERIDRDRREAKEKVRPRTPEEQAEWERRSRQRGAPQSPPPVPPPVPPPPPNRGASPLVSQMSGPDWDAIEEGDYGAAPWWDAVPGLDALDDDVFEDPYGDEGEFNPWDPDARSMDSQMLADLNMRRARQDQQGYFGWAGDAVSSLADTVSGMSNTERAALVAALVAAGVLTVGSGGALAPAAAGLVGAAGLGALSNAP